VMSNHAWTPKHFGMWSAVPANASQYYMLRDALHMTEVSPVIQ
jgi:hypothetical protein